MAERDLGKLESVHGIAPAFLQRAAIIALISFIFFLAMIFAFSLRQNIGYFLLAAAFLVVQLFTLTGWIMQKRAELRLYENGFTYKKHACRWSEIESLTVKKGNYSSSYEIKKKTDEKIVLTDAIHNIESVIKKIEAKTRERKLKDAANATH